MVEKKDKQLTIKQKKFIKEVSKGKSGTEAALISYDTTDYDTASNIAYLNMRKPQIRDAIRKEMSKQGLTLEKIIKPVTEALDADDVEMKLKGHDRAIKLLSFADKEEKPNVFNFNFKGNANFNAGKYKK